MFSKNKIRTMLLLTAMALLAFSCKKHETAAENQVLQKLRGQLKSKLLTNYPNKTTQINQLFTSYGY